MVLEERVVKEITEREYEAAQFIDTLYEKMEYWDLEDKVLTTNYYNLKSIHKLLSPAAIRENTNVPTSNNYK